MKYFSIILFTLLAITACQSEQEASTVSTDLINLDTANAARFEFETVNYNFGEVSEGEKVSYSYKFVNTGNSDLIITSARGSCGCTVPSYPKEPIPPGGSGSIDVTFDSEGRPGRNQKSVTLVANTYPATFILNLEGEVLMPEGEIKTDD